MSTFTPEAPAFNQELALVDMSPEELSEVMQAAVSEPAITFSAFGIFGFDVATGFDAVQLSRRNARTAFDLDDMDGYRHWADASMEMYGMLSRAWEKPGLNPDVCCGVDNALWAFQDMTYNEIMQTSLSE